MNRTKWILAVVTVLLISSTAVLLARYKSMQRLGNPGVKTQPIANSKNLDVVLPETVLDYTSEVIPQSEVVTNVLPKDTCYGQRRYTGSNSNSVQVNVVLMGEDRTSLHKPQFCLTGAGWTINSTEVESIRVEKPEPYDLKVIKLTVAGEFTQEGRQIKAGGVYVYWYVADGLLSADPTGSDRMWSIARGLITEGILQRWAYVTFFEACEPGREEETYERLKKLIAAAVPEFQLTHGGATQTAANKP
jgi:Protein of unknown function (DUF3485)